MSPLDKPKNQLPKTRTNKTRTTKKTNTYTYTEPLQTAYAVGIAQIVLKALQQTENNTHYQQAGQPLNININTQTIRVRAQALISTTITW